MAAQETKNSKMRNYPFFYIREVKTLKKAKTLYFKSLDI